MIALLRMTISKGESWFSFLVVLFFVFICGEEALRVFFHFVYAHCIWNWLYKMFEIDIPMVTFILSKKFNSRYYNICLTLCLSIIREIWRIANSTRFGNGDTK